MKKLLPLILVVGTMACNNQRSTTTTTETSVDSTVGGLVSFEQEHKSLDSALQQMQTPSQFFKAPLHHPVTFTCAKGTLVNVNGDDLATVSGKPMGNHIDVEVKELTNQEELALNQAGTVSNGELLESGGAYYINLTSDGEQLKLKEGKTLNVRLATVTNEGMSVFYGKRDTENLMNWLPAPVQPVPLESATHDSIKKEYSEYEAVMAYADSSSQTQDSRASAKTKAVKEVKKGSIAYQAVALTELGWINCDRFRKEKNLTTVSYQLSAADSVRALKAFLVFRSINSVMESKAAGKDKGTFIHVPMGQNVTFVAIGFRNGKYYSYKTPVTVGANQVIDVHVKETAAADIKNLFK